MKYEYFSTFSGIGGFELGINERGKCVGYSEIDKYALDVYGRHFPKHTNYGDITKIEPTSLPNFNLFVGGFPCQAFSIAGKRRGFADTRGTMFFEICRIIGVKRPKYIVLENVKGILNHEKGRTFSTIIVSLQELGYDVEWVLLNSKFHGVPQNRERIFIVANLGERGRSKILPYGKSEKTANEPYKKSVNCIDSNYHRGIDNHGQRTIIRVNPGEQPQSGIIYSTQGIAPTLSANGGGLGAKTGLYKLTKDEVRRLTPIECERLQGFPDDYTAGHSDTQRYKMLGNAVTINVVKYLFDTLETRLL